MRASYWGSEATQHGDALAKPCNIAVVVAALLAGSAGACAAAESRSSATSVEFETPIANPQPLQGMLRRPNGTGAFPAVVLLHSCNGDWRRLDLRWGKRIASWGYVTLTVDSFGPRGLHDTCDNGAPVDLAFDAYRALTFLAQQPFVDAARVAAVGFSQGGWLALTSVERGIVQQAAPNKFRAAVAFYPPCRAFRDNMTVPTLILTGELDDWSPADECRKMLDGLDDWGISRQKSDSGAPVRLIVYPDAHHAFDVPGLRTPAQLLGHRLEYNQAAADQSIGAVREFLDATIGVDFANIRKQ
jgi:dienelactone hydrolase